ncbi:MAG: AmmeMemoRadiSam system protein A [Chloroflexi bacterium]|nr:AmmeMemoRadiSam system protein A [Chloroflexota bacterium]
MHPFPSLARAAVESFVRDGSVLAPPQPLLPEMQRRAAVFVSLHFEDGALRGCIGTIQPTEEHIADEIIRNAIAAATRDPRFMPVAVDELPMLVYSVDVLGEAEPVGSVADLDPQRFGIIVQRGVRRGLLLPDIEGVDSAPLQIAIALDKAGIDPREGYELMRFEVQRFH